MKSLQYKNLNDNDLLNRYYVSKNGGYFLKQEMPQIHKEMINRGLI